MVATAAAAAAAVSALAAFYLVCPYICPPKICPLPTSAVWLGLLCPQVMWPGGVMARALDLRLKRSPFESRPFRFQVTTLGKLFTHTCASVTKQYNLVPVKGQWCPAAGKVTVGPRRTGHASQTSVVYPPTGSRPKKGMSAPRLHSSWGMALLFTLGTLSIVAIRPSVRPSVCPMTLAQDGRCILWLWLLVTVEHR